MYRWSIDWFYGLCSTTIDRSIYWTIDCSSIYWMNDESARSIIMASDMGQNQSFSLKCSHPVRVSIWNAVNQSNDQFEIQSSSLVNLKFNVLGTKFISKRCISNSCFISKSCVSKSCFISKTSISKSCFISNKELLFKELHLKNSGLHFYKSFSIWSVFYTNSHVTFFWVTFDYILNDSNKF